MAKRPVFETFEKQPFFRKKDVEFTFYSGFSMAQKKRCVESLHGAYSALFPGKRVLEISNASDHKLGVSLSAFNLMILPKKGKPYSVECAFQGAKVFEQGGPYRDLIHKTSREAKTDARLRESGKVIGFHIWNIDFPTKPETFFYNWLYINTLAQHRELHDALLEYDAFTDIMFHPEKSLNCQAEAAAIFVSLLRCDMLNKALKDRESFLETVYGTPALSILSSNSS